MDEETGKFGQYLSKHIMGTVSFVLGVCGMFIPGAGLVFAVAGLGFSVFAKIRAEKNNQPDLPADTGFMLSLAAVSINLVTFRLQLLR